jgi:hypothetical protein
LPFGAGADRSELERSVPLPSSSRLHELLFLFRLPVDLGLRNIGVTRTFHLRLDEEVRLHVKMQIEENLNAAMNQQRDGYTAMRSFGGPGSI